MQCKHSKGIRHSLHGQERLPWREWSNYKESSELRIKSGWFCLKGTVKTSQVMIQELHTAYLTLSRNFSKIIFSPFFTHLCPDVSWWHAVCCTLTSYISDLLPKMLEVPKFMKNDYIFLLNYRGPKVTRGITLVFCNTFLSRI